MKTFSKTFSFQLSATEIAKSVRKNPVPATKTFKSKRDYNRKNVKISVEDS